MVIETRNDDPPLDYVAERTEAFTRLALALDGLKCDAVKTAGLKMLEAIVESVKTAPVSATPPHHIKGRPVVVK